jgi:fatty-acyl-CoA synthase
MGAVLVNINAAYLRDELQYALNTVECRALIVAPGFRKIDYLAILRELSPEMTDAADHQWKSDSLP